MARRDSRPYYPTGEQMNRCHYCKWERGCHDPACPAIAPQEHRENALEDYRRGAKEGRAGKDLPVMENATYRLGWLSGVVALEEAENGYDPKFH